MEYEDRLYDVRRKDFYERLEAREEGREEGRREFVKKMLEKGMPEEEICEFMECDMDYIAKLQEEMQDA